MQSKAALDHISTHFSLSRRWAHNKLCVGQCSSLNNFGVVKVRARACLLNTNRAGQSHPTAPIPSRCNRTYVCYRQLPSWVDGTLFCCHRCPKSVTDISLSLTKMHFDSPTFRRLDKLEKASLTFWWKHHFITFSSLFLLFKTAEAVWHRKNSTEVKTLSQLQ